LVQKLRSVEPDMVSQVTSPLGRRRHCAAVQRRVAAGIPGAAIVGRKHLLSREALNDELSKQVIANSRARATETPSITEQLAKEVFILK
jgi:hypothetical protein